MLADAVVTDSSESVLVPMTEQVHHLKIHTYIWPFKSHLANLPNKELVKGATTAVAMNKAVSSHSFL